MPKQDPRDAAGPPGAENPHDRLFCKVYSRTEQAEALLRLALPPALSELIAWETLAPAPGDFFTADLAHARADRLFVAELRCGWGRIYLLLEHATRPDRATVWQVVHYGDRIVKRDATLEPRLPHAAVVPVVVYPGRRPWRIGLGRPSRRGGRPTQPPPPLLPFLAWTRIVPLGLAGLTEEAVLASAGPALHKLVVLCMSRIAAQPRGEVEAALRRWRHLWRELHAVDPDDDVETLFSYILYTTRVPYDELKALFVDLIGPPAEVIMTSTADKMVKQAGRKAIAELLLSLLRAKFESVPADIERRVRAATSDDLERWARALLRAASLDELFTA